MRSVKMSTALMTTLLLTVLRMQPAAYFECHWQGCSMSNNVGGTRCLDGFPDNCATFAQHCEEYCEDLNGVDLSRSYCIQNQQAVCYCYDDWACSEQEMCEGSGGTWNSETGCHGATPILINLAANGPADHLTSTTDGVWFDIDGDGSFERVAWTSPGDAVAFLAIDLNGNGTIDSGSELLGSAFRLRSGKLASNGFEALRELDGGSESDGAISQRDPAYSRLILWMDRNHNGVSEPEELLKLPTAGVTAISTSYRETDLVDRNGNWYRYAGKALLRHGRSDVPRYVWDVVLRVEWTTTQ
jgi:hypothetical protein